MELKTLLNQCYGHKGFVYQNANFLDQSKDQIEVPIKPRANSDPTCSGCGKRSSTYDHLPERKFEFIPFWGFKVFFSYSRRRVNCLGCGIIAEDLPWSEGKHHLTKPYMHFLSSWAKKLSWKDVAASFRTSWDKVAESVRYVVEWGLQRRDLSNITAIGVDEIQYRRGHKYLTLVYQINSECVRLLWVGKDRTEETFSKFFDFLGEERSKLIEYVCSDMWKAYLKVIKQRASRAVHILDKFHIVARLNKAIDEVRAGEHRNMKQQGYEPLLTRARWLLLKNPENLNEHQDAKLKDLLNFNLRSIRAYLLKEQFQQLWEYISPTWAGKFLDQWIKKVMLSKIEPMKREAKTLRKHRELVLNYFRAKKAFTSGIVEGLNTKVKLTVRKSYGFRTQKWLEIALYHALGKLPEPKTTHEFF